MLNNVETGKLGVVVVDRNSEYAPINRITSDKEPGTPEAARLRMYN